MDEVDVVVFLAGAHHHRWRCAADHPSVRVLMDALSANAHPQHHAGTSPIVRLVVPAEGGGERGIVFLRQALVAVETQPPLIDLMPTIHSARRSWVARQGASDSSVTRPEHVVLADFLPAEIRNELFAWILAHEADFLPSGVRSRPGNASDDYDFRRSKVSMNVREWRSVFESRLGAVMPAICEQLGEAVPERPHLELQMTHHGHLDGFKVHTDNSTGTLRQRRISLVYYLHRHPRPFRGGELVLYDQIRDDEGRPHKGEGFRIVQPDDNTLVAFQSGFHHQVRTVQLADGSFADGRITVNGWLRDLDVA